MLFLLFLFLFILIFILGFRRFGGRGLLRFVAFQQLYHRLLTRIGGLVRCRLLFISLFLRIRRRGFRFARLLVGFRCRGLRLFLVRLLRDRRLARFCGADRRRTLHRFWLARYALLRFCADAGGTHRAPWSNFARACRLRGLGINSRAGSGKTTIPSVRVAPCLGRRITGAHRPIVCIRSRGDRRKRRPIRIIVIARIVRMVRVVVIARVIAVAGVVMGRAMMRRIGRIRIIVSPISPVGPIRPMGLTSVDRKSVV